MAALATYLSTLDVAVLNPKGPIGVEEQHLILIAAALSLVVVLPVIGLLIAFAVRYREGNTKSRYAPNLRNSRKVEAVWWVLPSVLIGVLSVITWTSSHELDPYAPLKSGNAAIKVQVVAMDWKWLFVYPDQGIASVNALVIPVDTPVHFLLTADGPMNTLWIPQLSGQIYAMPGMQTQLNIQASEEGTYSGLSANLSGKGFSGMRFKTTVVSNAAFQTWIGATRASPEVLDRSSYAQLQAPSIDVPPAYFRLADQEIFPFIIDQYMTVPSSPSPMGGSSP